MLVLTNNPIIASSNRTTASFVVHHFWTNPLLHRNRSCDTTCVTAPSAPTVHFKQLIDRTCECENCDTGNRCKGMCQDHLIQLYLYLRLDIQKWSMKSQKDANRCYTAAPSTIPRFSSMLFWPTTPHIVDDTKKTQLWRHRRVAAGCKNPSLQSYYEHLGAVLESKSWQTSRQCFQTSFLPFNCSFHLHFHHGRNWTIGNDVHHKGDLASCQLLLTELQRTSPEPLTVPANQSIGTA